MLEVQNGISFRFISVPASSMFVKAGQETV